MNPTTRNDSDTMEVAEWWVIGAWIRLALSGAMVAFGGVAMLAQRPTPDLVSLGFVVVGAAVAAGAKRMAQRAIERLDVRSGTTATAASESQSLPRTMPQRQRRRAWAVSP